VETHSILESGSRVLSLLGVGVLCFLVWLVLQRGWRGGAALPGEPYLWVADRDGEVLCSLDSEGLVVSRSELAGVVELAALQDSNLWGLIAPAPGATARRLELLTPVRVSRPAFPLPFGAHSLAALPENHLGLLVRFDLELVWLQLDAAGRPLGSVPAGDAIGWEIHDESLALFGSAWIRWYDPQESPREWRLPRTGELLAHCGWERELWALIRSTTDFGEAHLKLWRIPAPMDPRAVVELGGGLSSLRGTWTLVPGSRRVLWLVNSLGTVIRFDLGTGRRVVSRLQPPLVSSTPDGDGGLFALSPGAVQRIGSDGQPQPGQGGFSFLSSSALRRPPELGQEMTKGRAD
jgi:hypothetical protein